MDKAILKAANILTLNVQKLTNPGILHGSLGVALFLYEYSRHSGFKCYSDIADNIVDGIMERKDMDFLPLDIEGGLSGIGYGLNHIMKRSFAEGDPQEVLEDIDNKIIASLESLKDFKHETNSDLFYHGLYIVSRFKDHPEEEKRLRLYQLIDEYTSRIYSCQTCEIPLMFSITCLFVLKNIQPDVPGSPELYDNLASNIDMNIRRAASNNETELIILSRLLNSPEYKWFKDILSTKTARSDKLSKIKTDSFELLIQLSWWYFLLFEKKTVNINHADLVDYINSFEKDIIVDKLPLMNGLCGIGILMLK